MKTTILIITLFLFLSCSNGDKVKEINLNLSNITEDSSFSLDSINTSDWDSVYILTPYAIVPSNEYQIQESTQKMLQDLTLFDSQCTLLFIKDKALINYSSVPRNIADFADIKGNNTFHSKQIYKLDNARNVLIVD